MERLNELEKEITEMRKILYERENELYELKKKWLPNPQVNVTQAQYQSQNSYQYQDQDVSIYSKLHVGDKLPRWAIERYSRQILLPDIGVTGQEKICRARILIVGAGGLGCPAASYLAGAGVGEIGIVDYDTVDVTNIHRQLLHSEQDQYMNKVESAANALRRINSHVTITPYHLQLDSTNVLDIVSKYDLVLDCTDNVPTRYLLNDSCVLLKIPLISGSALKMEGQLTIYVYKPNKYLYETDSVSSGPCYRCLFPSPPPPETVGSCSAQGVAGPVPGVIGALQALEAIKYIVGKRAKSLLVGRMLLFDGEDCTFRTVKLRPKSPNCAACSDNPTVTQLLDYESFCRTTTKEKDIDLKILPQENRTSPAELVAVLASADKENLDSNHESTRHLLVDVRSEPEFQMCRIEGAVNYPIDKLSDEGLFSKLLEEIGNSGNRVIFVCRRGNDSQLVAKRVMDAMVRKDVVVKDLAGGLHAWSREIDNEFPIY